MGEAADRSEVVRVDSGQEQIRVVQETVSGKEITLAHVIGGPEPVIYTKLGLDPSVDYGSSALGIMNITPPESAVIASDIAIAVDRKSVV